MVILLPTGILFRSLITINTLILRFFDLKERIVASVGDLLAYFLTSLRKDYPCMIVIFGKYYWLVLGIEVASQF